MTPTEACVDLFEKQITPVIRDPGVKRSLKMSMCSKFFDLSCDVRHNLGRDLLAKKWNELKSLIKEAKKHERSTGNKGGGNPGV